MDKFQNKYRIPSARAPFWDYGSNAAYFVTICTKARHPFFGEIMDGKMNYSEIGKIANACWDEIPQHFPFVELGAHITMPNHVHGIVVINNVETQDLASHYNRDNNVKTQNFASHDDHDNNDGIVQTQNIASHDDRDDDGIVQTQNIASHDDRDDDGIIETQNFASLRGKSSPNKFGPQSKNLASIIRGFKIGVTKNARLHNPDFAWQPRYHDHIIRNDQSYRNIENYILTNPQKWADDELNK